MIVEEKKIAYVDGVDWQFHLEGDAKGVTFFGNVEDLKKDSPCTRECGIIEVEITVKQWVAPQTI